MAPLGLGEVGWSPLGLGEVGWSPLGLGDVGRDPSPGPPAGTLWREVVGMEEEGRVAGRADPVAVARAHLAPPARRLVT